MQHVLIMGVCGTGKSTVARGLADRLGAAYIEADNHHSDEAVSRMSRGQPLTDAHRWVWLDRIAEAAGAAPGATVIACSALKRAYRQRLSDRLGGLGVVHLHGSKALVGARMVGRIDHFMPVSLIDSQFADLEPPTGARVLQIDVARPLEEIVEAAYLFATGGGQAPAQPQFIQREDQT